MNILAVIMVALVALLYFYFLRLEMFFWEKPLGLRTFGIKPECQVIQSARSQSGTL